MELPGSPVEGRFRLRAGTAIAAIALLSSLSGFLPPLAGIFAQACLLAAAVTAIVAAARVLRPLHVSSADDGFSVRTEKTILGGCVLAAIALRLPGLSSVPPGLNADEAYHLLQSIAAWSGDRIPEMPEYPYPTYPVWWAMTAAATRLLGPGFEAARAVSACLGVFAVLIAWKCARDLLGRAAGIGAALFMCGSFWHVHYSRVALEYVALVDEGLITAWLLLSPRASGRRWAAGLAGAISGAACYGYTAAFYLPVWGALACLLKVMFPEGGRRKAVRLAIAYVLGVSIILLPGFNHVKLRIDRAGAVKTRVTLLGSSSPLGAPVSLLAPAPASGGPWTPYPPLHPRLSGVERAACCLGLCCLIAAPQMTPAGRLSLGLMLPLALAPEMGAGEIHLSRGLGALAPLALLAGLSVTLLLKLDRRLLLAVGLAAALNTARTARCLYVDFPRNPTVQWWYETIYVRAAATLDGLSREGRISLSPEPTYERKPIMRALLWRAIREGRITPSPLPPVGEGVKVLFKFRHPVEDDPFLLIMGTERFPADRRICLGDIIGMLEPARRSAETGDLAGAESYCRQVLELVPDSRYTRARLSFLLHQMGREAQALKELERAGLPLTSE